MATLLTSWKLGYVDLKDWDLTHRIVLEEHDYVAFRNKMKDWEKYLKLGEDFVFWSQIQGFWVLKIDNDALEQYRKLEKDIQVFVVERIKRGYRVRTLDDLRFSVALYYEVKQS